MMVEPEQPPRRMALTEDNEIVYKCAVCERFQSAEAFDRDGETGAPHDICRKCMDKQRAEAASAQLKKPRRLQSDLRKRALVPVTEKVCAREFRLAVETGVGHEEAIRRATKPADAFSLDTHNIDKLASSCLQCVLTMRRERQERKARGGQAKQGGGASWHLHYQAVQRRASSSRPPGANGIPPVLTGGDAELNSATTEVANMLTAADKDTVQQVLDSLLKLQEAQTKNLGTLEERVGNIERWLADEDQWHNKVVERLKELETFRGAMESFNAHTIDRIMALERGGSVEEIRQMLVTHREVIARVHQELGQVQAAVENLGAEMQQRHGQRFNLKRQVVHGIAGLGKRLADLEGTQE